MLQIISVSTKIQYLTGKCLYFTVGLHCVFFYILGDVRGKLLYSFKIYKGQYFDGMITGIKYNKFKMGALIYKDLGLFFTEFARRLKICKFNFCPRSLDLFYTLTYYSKWVKPFWTDSK